jgi:enoyl-CoA hydratase/carnithine racemase
MRRDRFVGATRPDLIEPIAQSSDMSELQIDSDAGVVRLTLNRPERRNALSRSLLGELERAISALAVDESARVVVLAGAGKIFCSGHDLSEMVGRDEAEYRDLFSACARVMLGLRNLPQPVIARVHGMATAAGCQLVASCDLVVATSTAQFAAPGVKIGLFCTTPMIPLVRAIPPRVAMEMLLTGNPISAERALAVGLVNRVVAEESLDEAVAEMTSAIVAASPEIVALGKRAFYDQLQCDEATAYEKGVEIITQNACHPDAQEGIGAFLEKRTPTWGKGS